MGEVIGSFLLNVKSILMSLLAPSSKVYFSTAFELVLSNMVGFTAITNHVPMNFAVSQFETTCNAGKFEEAEFPILSSDQVDDAVGGVCSCSFV